MNGQKGKEQTQITDDAFAMAIYALAGNFEPISYVMTKRDHNDFKVTAIYSLPSGERLPFFSDFYIVSESDPSIKIRLKDYKKNYMSFRNLILDKVQLERDKAKKQEKQTKDITGLNTRKEDKSDIKIPNAKQGEKDNGNSKTDTKKT